MNLGKSIQTCRLQRGLSQADLAKSAGISVSYLSMLENSKRDPTISTVQQIASALGVPIEILFFLGAEQGELAGIDKDLAGQLALTALGLLNEKSKD
jgi:transcriptional regulator with XRE-family HTH domain